MTLPPEWKNPEPSRQINVIDFLMFCLSILVLSVLWIYLMRTFVSSEPELPDHCNATWKETKK